MKSSLAVAGTIISYFIYARADPSLENYYCGKNIIESEVVERGRNNACLSLGGSPWWVEFPASLDGSKIFGIKDATLFSWPLGWDSVKEVAGRKAGNLRVVIDSTCNLIGVIHKIDNTYQKCIQPLNPSAIPTFSLELSLRNPIKTYGIDCNGFIFFEKELDGAYDSLHHYSATGALSDHFKEPSGFLQSHTLSELDNERVWSWPVQFTMERQTSESTRESVFRTTINRTGNKRGMIYKKGDSWRRCSDIRYTDNNPSALKKHKTSVGKNFLYRGGDFQCGDQTIDTITINSHQQAACPRVRELVKSGNMNELLYPWSPPDSSYKSRKVWYWPIRKPELSIGQELDNSKHQLISLGSDCEFLNVYYLVDKRKTECQKLNKSVLPLGLQTKSATVDLNPLKRKHIEFD